MRVEIKFWAQLNKNIKGSGGDFPPLNHVPIMNES
jgi:hypothetical protein